MLIPHQYEALPVEYLAGRRMHGNDDHVEQRRAYAPDARDGEWRFRKGGQRVKIIKNTEDGGKLKMGAEFVASEDKKTEATPWSGPG